MSASTRIDLLLDRIVCPDPGCRAPLQKEAEALRCLQCPTTYTSTRFGPDLRARSWRETLGSWRSWEHLQENGLASYVANPEQNLSHGKRADCEAFARFCGYAGWVLDVGCGPQAWPAYFAHEAPGTTFVGIDPLEAFEAPRYHRLQALAELLPFRDEAFDQVLFATSLDHVLDPVRALADASRVCRGGGHVNVWSGEKRAGAPRPTQSPAWYQALRVPEGAEDPFHMKRFTEDEVQRLFEAARLRIVEHAAHPVDTWRTNHFYRLSADH